MIDPAQIARYLQECNFIALKIYKDMNLIKQYKRCVQSIQVCVVSVWTTRRILFYLFMDYLTTMSAAAVGKLIT
jgi:hypothetical protein